MSTHYIQIPPDSTGKRIRHNNRLDVIINNITVDLSLLDEGDVITGVSSGASGKYVGHNTELGVSYIFLSETTGTFTNGEVLSSVLGNSAEVVSTTEIHTPSIVISDANNPKNRQKIDDNGNAYTRFDGGNPLFSSFGSLAVSETSLVDFHTYTHGDRSDKYYTNTLTGGACTWSSQNSSLLFSVNSTSGSYSSRTTNINYPYTPNIGTEYISTVQLGDSSKAGVIRRWGLFNDNDGVFFENSGSIFQCVIRDSSTGVVVDTKFPQSLFNGDHLDDISTSEYVLDLTKYNIYWIDYQWLGAGVVRFGTFSPTGKKIAVHTVHNANEHTNPYMNTGTLPFRMEMYNETATAGISEMSTICTAIVKQSDRINYHGKTFTQLSNTVNITGSTLTPILSFKPSTLFNGKPNNTLTLPLDFEYSVSDRSDILLEILVNSNLTGSTFSSPTASFQSTLCDISATSLVGGGNRSRIILNGGETRREIREDIENSLTLLADGSQPTMTLAAKLLNNTGSANLTMLVRWKETR